jgi:opacity protein-like surface antigen
MLRRIIVIVLLVAFSSTVLAQYDNPRKKRSAAGSRDGRFETSVILAYQTGKNETSEGGSSLDIDSTLGWGLNFGWNLTAKWNLSYKFVSTKPNYLAVIVPEDPNLLPQSIDEKLSKSSHQFNVTYNFREKALTPFVLAGIGWTKVDSNVPTGSVGGGCWWDPWWGYICFADWKTYETTEFSYNLGLGVRWDINNALFTKAAYSREFLKLDNGTFNFDMAILEFGLMF